jgi:hypothetical protein
MTHDREPRRTGADGNYDIGILLRAAATPLIIWFGMVAVVTYAGSPGVVCVTPMAWLLGCWTGVYCANTSRSAERQRLIEALTAGAIVGLLQGLLFFVDTWRWMPVTPAEEPGARYLALGMTVFGTLATALLSLWTAALRNRRLRLDGQRSGDS